MSEEFKPGDVVELKSGSPPMTIERKSRTDESVWVCLWFEGATKKEAQFAPEVLKKHEGPGSAAPRAFGR